MYNNQGMGTVTVKKDELLEIVRKNREAHRKIFLEAVDGFRAKAVEMLEQRLTDAKAGRRINIRISLPTPVDQTREYDRAIKMLEMSVDGQVQLTQTEFAQYVMDDWSWKKQFSATNKMYSVTAALSDPSPLDDDDVGGPEPGYR